MEEKPRQLCFSIVGGSSGREEAREAGRRLEEALLARLVHDTFEGLRELHAKKGRTGKRFRSRGYLADAAGLLTISRHVLACDGAAEAALDDASYWTFADAEAAEKCYELACETMIELSIECLSVAFSRERIGAFQKPGRDPLKAVAPADALILLNVPYLEPEVDVALQPTAAGAAARWEVGGGHSKDAMAHLLQQAAHHCPGAVVTEVALVPCTTGAYLTFESPATAAAALEGLQGLRLPPAPTAPGARQVPLFVRPAQRRELRNVHADDCNCILCVPVCKQAYEPGTVPGLLMQEEFVTAEEEAALMEAIDQSGWAEPTTQHENMQRRVQHHGYAFDYNTRGVDVTKRLGCLPQWAETLVDRMMATGWLQDRPDQLTVNEYLPGQGIRCHVDTHSAFMREITSVSLGSSVAFNMFSEANVQTSVWVRRRTLLVMTEESRYAWRHSIGQRKFDPVEGVGLVARGKRLSITFRAVNKELVCQCRFPALCDSRGNGNRTAERDGRREEALPGKDGGQALELGAGLEQGHVVDFYETVAEHFSSTRHSPWPNVRKFILEQQELQPGCVIGDLGCGNGKYLKCVSKPCLAVGSDISSKLAAICQGQGFQVCTASSLDLPFRSTSFDVTLCIAVLHHISTPERRQRLVQEMVRVMRPGSVGLVYAWAFEQQVGATGARKFEHQDCFVPWHLPEQYLGEAEEEEALPCKGVRHEAKRTVELQRYCHLFRKGELEELLEEVAGVRVERSYYDQSNWCAVFRAPPAGS